MGEGSGIKASLSVPQELTLRMEQLQDNAFRKRKALDMEVTETLTSEIELDKTAEAFRQAHHEREELIHQWEQTIEQMRRRDQEMDKCATVSPPPCLARKAIW